MRPTAEVRTGARTDTSGIGLLDSCGVWDQVWTTIGRPARRFRGRRPGSVLVAGVAGRYNRGSGQRGSNVGRLKTAGLAILLAAGPAAAGPERYLDKPADWYRGEDAARVAANVMSHQ